MDLDEFERSLTHSTPPHALSRALQALWHERRGDWDTAHDIAQDDDGAAAAWVHAYLHRREGDLSNAAYWYRMASKPAATNALDEEWRAIVSALLARR